MRKKEDDIRECGLGGRGVVKGKGSLLVLVNRRL